MKALWKKTPRWLRIILILLGSLTLVIALFVGGIWWYLHPAVERTNGIVYGERNGKPLTLDIIRPAKGANGKGVALMVSGGWKSDKPGGAPTWMMAPVLRRGYTVFAVCHISQPESTVMEIIEDVNRGIRFVRHHADEYEIDPDKIGVTGGSAGGHLSLMLATQGGPGDPNSDDPVEQESSAVQAVAIFFPVTDLLNLGKSTENLGDGGPPKSFKKSFGPGVEDLEYWKKVGRQCSPIYHIDEDLPPTLIYHGDADTLTPLEQSEWFRERAAEAGHEVDLVVHPGGEHGWLTMIWDIIHFGDWFDQHLK